MSTVRLTKGVYANFAALQAAVGAALQAGETTNGQEALVFKKGGTFVVRQHDDSFSANVTLDANGLITAVT